MKTAFFFILITLTFPISGVCQRAELHLVNTSARSLTIKVMEEITTRNDTLQSVLTVHPYSRKVEYFTKTGDYYLKTEASLAGKESIYTKGNPFRVYVGSDGYSVLTITYAITESTAPDPVAGSRISKIEFDRN